MTTVTTSQSAGRTEITRLLSVILSARLVINTAYRIGYAFVPELSRGLGIDLPAMGALISARSFAGMLAPVFGSLSDRYGRRPMMFGGLVLLIALATLAYLSTSLLFFAIGFVGLGVAKVMFDPSGSAFLGDRVPYARRGLVLGLGELGWSGGGLIGVPIAARAIALWGWQSPYALVALGGALALVWAAIALPKTDTAHHTQRVDTRAAFAAVARHRSAVIMLCVVASFMIGAEMINIAYATWLTQTFQLDVIALGGIVATFAAADVGGEVLSMTLVDRFGKKRALLAGYCATTLFYFAMPALGTSLPSAVAALFLYFVCFEFTIVSVFPLVSELVPETRGTIISLTALASSVGRAIGGLGGAWLFALGGFGANGATAGLVVGAATVLLAFGVRERR